MPNIKSAKKRVLITQKKTLRNKSINSDLKTFIKKAATAIETNTEEKSNAVKVAIKKIDKACAKGILHKNTASRKKAALTRKLNESA
jgi:small subunit ribosomal protein S20